MTKYTICGISTKPATNENGEVIPGNMFFFQYEDKNVSGYRIKEKWIKPSAIPEGETFEVGDEVNLFFSEFKQGRVELMMRAKA